MFICEKPDSGEKRGDHKDHKENQKGDILKRSKPRVRFSELVASRRVSKRYEFHGYRLRSKVDSSGRRGCGDQRQRCRAGGFGAPDPKRSARPFLRGRSWFLSHPIANEPPKMPRKENPGPISAQAQQDLVSEGIENFELPKSVVMKIAKSAVRALGFLLLLRFSRME